MEKWNSTFPEGIISWPLLCMASFTIEMSQNKAFQGEVQRKSIQNGTCTYMN
jgi:hypothetical protein